MKPTGQRWHLRCNNRQQLTGFIEHVEQKWAEGKDLCVQFLEGGRSIDQNTMIHALYGDIARQSNDKSVMDVTRECKLHYGVPILRAADPEFCAEYDQKIKALPYETKLLIVGYMDVTKNFTKAQASEYIDTIISEYTGRGYALSREEA